MNSAVIEQMDAAALEAEKEYSDWAEVNPDSAQILREWAIKHKNKAGWKRLAQILAK